MTATSTATAEATAFNDTHVKDAVHIPHAAKVAREDRGTVGEARVMSPRMRCTDINVYYGEK
ncbi:MAG: hypothetical protein WCE38_22545, partial [Burkholderiales bacterium]